MRGIRKIISIEITLLFLENLHLTMQIPELQGGATVNKKRSHRMNLTLMKQGRAR